MPSAARAAKHEEPRYEKRAEYARCDQATKYGAPACKTLHMWNREVTHAGQTQKKMLCRLTLELSGGEAVRLERVVRATLSAEFLLRDR
jgi:hypothetical protein